MKNLIRGILFDNESTDWILLAEHTFGDGLFRNVYKYVGDRTGIEYVVHSRIILDADVPLPPVESLKALDSLTELDNIINNWRGTVYWEHFK